MKFKIGDIVSGYQHFINVHGDVIITPFTNWIYWGYNQTYKEYIVKSPDHNSYLNLDLNDACKLWHSTKLEKALG